MFTKQKHLNISHRGEEGMALIVAFIFVIVAIGLLSSLSVQIINQSIQQNKYSDFRDAFWGAVSAVQESKSSRELGGNGLIGVTSWTPSYNDNNEPILPSFDSSSVTPRTLSSDPAVQYYAVLIPWENDNFDNNGDGVVDDITEQDMFSIYAVAQKNGVVRRLEVITDSTDVNVWRNAIFAGDGQVGNVINGNVSIHGSVHILGNNLLPGNPAITALDLSGTALIHNNYQGVPGILQQRVPPLQTTLFDGETVETLNAKLRVKRGLVGLSGTSEIGEPHVRGNGWKETMDGTYVNDGWTGNQTIPDGARGIPKNVYSDNGFNELYDLGNRVNFPRLTDDWREPDGSKVMNPNTGTWYSVQDYFSQVLLADPVIPNDGVFVGNLVLNAKGNKIFWDATTGTYLNGSLPASLPPNDHDYIWFDPTTNVLRINGQIRIDGNLTFTGQGNDRTINYSGRAALLVYGDVNIDSDLVTCNNGDPNNTANSYPVNNVIGIMSSNNMFIGNTAQCDIMGAFYAQNMIKISKQTDIMGTIVASYFDMGSQVPNIYQVPALADNLPYGMIGNYPITTLQQVGWRELGI
ncbi:MAG TPA: hypothetical protein PLT82_12350 [Candidatus Hydrogenedens sp.]|nr:hypothetical protein [Candidatus Hydrogenedens sp.]HOL20635.1 hypothetical protein [Candidatus Hydrogenedens sp.]HPP59911.1 hypothetical protein [Candidatus Hydrogenedens sp.]